MNWNTKTLSWVKKFLTVNPVSTDGMPIVGKFRTPAPGSRPEKYVYPKSKASNISNNYYFQRDTRRNYPRLAVYTQQDVAGLLEGSVKASLPKEGVEQAVAAVESTKPLVEVLNTHKLYTVQKQAPTPRFGRQVTWKKSEDFIPPNDGSYFPMIVIT
ncbi:hypothetical protein BDB01DRAFT_895370 [Pilobolus umbonatus]|nr:hypothetical protein BDB01DRAFT_895370 [Pilobolus umbonatus]